MKILNYFTYLIFSFFMIYSTHVGAFEPIVMKVSDSKHPPIHKGHYEQIGYWDVDDLVGNGGSGSSFDVNSLSTTIRTQSCSGIGTYNSSNPTCGSYMASMAIDRAGLGQITELTITASDNTVWKIFNTFRKSRPTDRFLNERLQYNNNNLKEYIVGIWDVDGGGGFGQNGSKGKYGMTLSAKLRKNNTDRRLEDLKLIASNNKGPAVLSGYDLVGYWDVDKGGARGTDNSKGSYMMTLLAKWSK